MFFNLQQFYVKLLEQLEEGLKVKHMAYRHKVKNFFHHLCWKSTITVLTHLALFKQVKGLQRLESNLVYLSMFLKS